MYLKATDLRLVDVVYEDGSSWLLFRVVCGDAGTGELRVLDASVA
jgi:hypothetical protein